MLFDIRRDLFAHLQTLPLRFFDTRRHGDVMSYFTNDVDTISDALNNSFAMVIQSFIQMAGTLVILFHPQLAAFPDRHCVLCGDVLVHPLQRQRAARPITPCSRKAWASWTAISRRWSAGQKVVKVFNHEAENLQELPREKRGAAQGGHRRADLCRHNDPRGGEHLLHQLCHCGGAGRHYGACRA